MEMVIPQPPFNKGGLMEMVIPPTLSGGLLRLVGVERDRE